MKRLLLLVAILAAISVELDAQTKDDPLSELSSLTPSECVRTSASLPAVRGLKLGMSQKSVLDLVTPTMARHVETFKRISSSGFLDPELGRNLLEIRYELFDDKVSSLQFRYSQWPWNTEAAAESAVTDQLGLNAKCWVRKDLGITSSYNGGDISVEIGLRSLELRDLKAAKAKADQDKKAAEEKKKTFKF